MRFHALRFTLTLTLTLGCGIDDAELAETEQSIINGYTLSQSTSNMSTNMVLAGNCSGVALDSEWILTANHCSSFDTAYLYYPAEGAFVREVWPLADIDIKLIRGSGFDSTTLKPLELWNASMSSLVGQTVTCLGRGYDTFGGWSGSAVWRWANMQPSVATTNGYWVYPNAAGQIPWEGDSGGPCVLNNKVTGIISGGNSNSETQQVTSAYLHGLTPSATDRIENIRRRARMFFYNDYDGTATLPAIERQGWFTPGQSLGGFSWGWNIVRVLRNGTIFFYKRDEDLAVISRVNKDGSYTQLRVLDGFTGKWTHATPVGRDSIFLYNSAAGTGVVGRVASWGPWSEGPRMSGFSTWTHIAGTANGGLFFYDRNTRIAAAGRIDGNRLFAQTGVFYNLSDWTHVTGFGQQEILYYNQNTGGAYHAWLSDQGVYYSIGTLAGIGSGYPWAVASTNGYVTFIGPSGYGRVGRPNYSGGMVYSHSGWGFPVGYSHVSAE
jgi:hypothetical protein